MIHGSNVSIGCLAMTDPVIEEIYLIVEAALAASQTKVPVQLFPFRMTSERLATAQNHPDYSFWLELKKLHDAQPPSPESPRPASAKLQDARQEKSNSPQ